MYEARQQKAPTSRTLSSSEQKGVQQFQKMSIQDNRIIQFYPHSTNEIACKPRRVDTFYGCLNGLEGRQGPHVVAFSAIHAMVKSFDVPGLYIYFHMYVFSPDRFKDSIMSEILTDEIEIENHPEWGSLGDIYNHYCEIYNECEALLEITFEMAPREDSLSVYNGEKEKYEQNIVLIRNSIECLLNLNIYATYAWHRNGGATKEELQGGGERAVNTADFSTANDVISSNCIDPLFATSGTFTNYRLFYLYLRSVLPNLPDDEINILILSMPKADVFLEQLNYDKKFIKYCLNNLLPLCNQKLKLLLINKIVEITSIKLSEADVELINKIAEILSIKLSEGDVEWIDFFCLNYTSLDSNVIEIIHHIIHYCSLRNLESEMDLVCQTIYHNNEELYDVLVGYGILLVPTEL